MHGVMNLERQNYGIGYSISDVQLSPWLELICLSTFIARQRLARLESMLSRLRKLSSGHPISMQSKRVVAL